jgi:peroxiredoxin Q/BCP
MYALALVAAMSLATWSGAQQPQARVGDQLPNLEVGAEAPNFALNDDTGKIWKSEDHYGKSIIVVYFYPAAMTGGCTAQACAFRDDMDALKAKGIEVVGVSGDDVSSLQLFKVAHTLNFALLSDTGGDVAKKFGVPTRAGGQIRSEINGAEHLLNRGVSASRWTFIIDKDKKVAMKNTQVSAGEDSKAVLDFVNKMAASP